MKQLVKAFKNPNKNYLLLIEEINRANVAAVFGDVFQLLDRDETGESEYFIATSKELQEYLIKEFKDVELSEEVSNKLEKDFSRLYLPSNLYIWATMNSADQGVMLMDTAFRRRWEFKYLGINDAADANKEDFANYKFKINSTETVKWDEFRRELNKKLSSLNIPEGKLIGQDSQEDEVRNILKSLSLMNIVKNLSKDTSKVELEELLDIESLEELNAQMESDMYVFKYVGILMVGEICLILYPKYSDRYLSDETNNFKMLKQIIFVIRKYQSKEQKIGLGEGIDLSNFNLLSITLELLNSYYEHGLYQNDRQIIEDNGDGEILWEKIINENTAYFSNGIPVYLDTFTINQESNEQDFFRRLHAFIITEACNRLKDILGILDI